LVTVILSEQHRIKFEKIVKQSEVLYKRVPIRYYLKRSVFFLYKAKCYTLCYT